VVRIDGEKLSEAGSWLLERRDAVGNDEKHVRTGLGTRMKDVNERSHVLWLMKASRP
jgi:hypothetical protein